jgi:hypothetical protein
VSDPPAGDPVADSLAALHAIVADPKAPSTARERAARTLLEVRGVVGRRPGEGRAGGADQALVAAVEEKPSPFAGYTAPELRAVGERLKELRECLERLAQSDGDVTEGLAAVSAEVEAIKAGRTDALLPAGWRTP